MIQIVSGVPRSGTSLMMQMLNAASLPLLTDGHRGADEDNPRGYFEWEKAKQIPKEPALIAEAEDKTVKVISTLLPSLPVDRHYKIIFMERPLDEVVSSQARMIQRLGTQGAKLPPAAMVRALRNHLNQVNSWLERQPAISVCRIAYHSLLADPEAECGRLAEFLETSLPVAEMVRQVDPSLYRQRG